MSRSQHHLPSEPPPDCDRCPRLVRYRRDCAASEPDWFNGAVASFGDAGTAKLIIVGLAPGLRGANRTGRTFTGDPSGELLYTTLLEAGFARGRYENHANDTLVLVDTVVTNAVRCVPPANKPVAAEIAACRPYLADLFRSAAELRVLVALGRIAHEATLGALDLRRASYKFAHGARHSLADNLVLFDSYHCSRYNTNTGRLTPGMFADVFRHVRDELA